MCVYKHPSVVRLPVSMETRETRRNHCTMSCWLHTVNTQSCAFVCVCVNFGIHQWLEVSKHAFVALGEHKRACMPVHICVCPCMYTHHATSLPNSLNLHYSAGLENAPSLLWRDEKMSGIPRNTSETERNMDKGWRAGDNTNLNFRPAGL